MRRMLILLLAALALIGGPAPLAANATAPRHATMPAMAGCDDRMAGCGHACSGCALEPEAPAVSPPLHRRPIALRAPGRAPMLFSALFALEPPPPRRG